MNPLIRSVAVLSATALVMIAVPRPALAFNDAQFWNQFSGTLPEGLETWTWIGDQRPGFPNTPPHDSSSAIRVETGLDMNANTLQLGIDQSEVWAGDKYANFYYEIDGPNGISRDYAGDASSYLETNVAYEISYDNYNSEGDWHFKIWNSAGVINEYYLYPPAGASYGSQVWAGEVEVDDENTCTYSSYWDYFGPVEALVGGLWGDFAGAGWYSTSYNGCGYLPHYMGDINNGDTTALAIY